jgi:hypothetical protein
MGIDHGASRRRMCTNVNGRLREVGADLRAQVFHDAPDMRIVRLQAAHAHRTFSWLARTKACAAWSTRLATRALTDAGVSSAFSRTAILSRRMRRSAAGFRFRRMINRPFNWRWTHA